MNKLKFNQKQGKTTVDSKAFDRKNTQLHNYQSKHYKTFRVLRIMTNDIENRRRQRLRSRKYMEY